MKIGADTTPTTGISGSNPETIIIRGHDLVQGLVGHVTFTDHTWLLITGELPTPAQRAMLDATLVAIAEHGLVPSAQTARMTLASAPEALQGAVAAGLLGCGSVILGASADAGALLAEILAQEAAGSSRSDAIATVVKGYRAQKRAVPGYGHPLHKGRDPRAVRLLEIAESLGLHGRHCAVALEVERMLPDLVNRPLVMNISAAIPSVLLDAGYPLLALRGVPLLARTAGLIGHLLEEQIHPIGFLMSHAAASAIRYDGPAPEGFVANEN